MTDERREAWLATLDPGIAPYVDVLNAAGIETYESCEGGRERGHTYAEPTIRFYGDSSEGFLALAVAVRNSLPVRAIRRFWSVNERGEPVGPDWEMAFWRRANDPRPQARRTTGSADGRLCQAPGS